MEGGSRAVVQQDHISQVGNVGLHREGDWEM